MPDVFRAVCAQQAGHARGDPASWIAFQQIARRLGLRISWNPGDIVRRFAKLNQRNPSRNTPSSRL